MTIEPDPIMELERLRLELERSNRALYLAAKSNQLMVAANMDAGGGLWLWVDGEPVRALTDAEVHDYWTDR